MNTRDRQRSIREVERNVARLVSKGWKVECIIHKDEPGAPFRTQIHVAKDGPSVIAEKPLVKNGEQVAAFEREFADYVGAKYAIALCNGTATLHTALVALGVKPGDRVAVPPLTMSATTIAVLHAGAVPAFCDVDPDTWLLDVGCLPAVLPGAGISVSLYGLHQRWCAPAVVDDAAQTLRHHRGPGFTSYSFQASKILPLGEGGMLVTNDEGLATRAREFSSLGYQMRADQPRIDPAVLKSPSYERHHSLGWNYRMNDLTATEGLWWLSRGQLGGRNVDYALQRRREAAAMYADAVAGCDWLTPQHVPNGWTHDYWCYAVAISADTGNWFPTNPVHVGPLHVLMDTIEDYGGERPYAAWRLTYHEPAFRHLAYRADVDALYYKATEGHIPRLCPVAEDLQPRLLQFQTNDIASAEKNANALRRAIKEIG